MLFRTKIGRLGNFNFMNDENNHVRPNFEHSFKQALSNAEARCVVVVVVLPEEICQHFVRRKGNNLILFVVVVIR